ncbi:Gfo/Idh/MocA family oxidoreductase [Acidobacteria bacterium AH-259-G07]|nr:Gfo/Idh/MocA family oxidoreductase [Acidobacteria bacterium AH-259-G07]
MNFGIIGFGYTGKQHARALTQLHEALVGVAEVDPEKRAESQVKSYRDYRSLVEDPTIDAVSVCLPHSLHEEVTSAALEAGKHVLVEKPLAMSVEEGERLCRLAKQVSRVMMVEMTHRFMPPLVEARELIQQGEIGEVLAVEDVVVESFGLFGSLPQWMFQRDQAGGGVGLTSGIHLLDHVSWLTGQALVLDSARFGYSQRLGDVEDTAAFSLSLNNGAPVHILLCLRAEGSGLEGRLNIYGENGTLRVEPWHGWKLELSDASREKAHFEDHLSIAERALVGMQGAIAEFIEAISKGRSPHPGPEETLVSQRIVEQAYQQASA